MKILLAILLVTIVSSQTHDTQITQLDFISNFSLGKQDQLNKTFTKIHEKLPTIPDVTYDTTSGISYIISNISTPHFFYIDSKQKATLEDQEVTISGGYLEADFTFNWTRKSPSGIHIDGYATAFGFSDQIIFSKELIDDRENKDLYWNLTETSNMTFDKGFTVVRVHPENTTEDDMVAIRKCINYIQDSVAVKDHLIDNIDSVFAYFLGTLLHQEKIPFDGSFNYTYENRHTETKHIVNFTADLKDVGLDRTGIKFDWKTQIVNDSNWKFLDYHVGLPFDVKEYGGIQEMVSFTVYENTARYAIRQGWLDSVLNQRNWESRFFQFYAGDLYEVIPKLATEYKAIEPIEGKCVASPTAFTIKKSTDKTFNVTMEYDCDLSAQRKKFIDFKLKQTLEIEGKPRSNHMRFQIDRHEFNVTFSPYSQYKLEKEDLARKMVEHSLNRLRESEVYGSGWHLLNRDYPHFHVQHEFTLVYDSTHVEQPELVEE